MITADQLVAHAVGDYILQSDWMANEKTKQNTAAVVHAMAYTVPFLFITQSTAALAVICGAHFVIDRWRLARYIVWAKNLLCPPPERPAWLSVWLLIIADNTLHVLIADNTLHVLCNGAAIALL